MSSNNHTKGLLNELLLGKHFAPMMTFHFREEEKSPEAIHGELKELIDSASYDRIVSDTFTMVGEVKARLIQDGWMANTVDVQSVTWTSNRDTDKSVGDHEMLTGIKDTNATADLIVHTISGNYVGISAKYGTMKNPNLKNPGLSTLESITGAIGLRSHWNEHIERLKTLGFTGTGAQRHEQFKLIRGTSDPRVSAALESSLRARHAMMDDIHAALLKKTSVELSTLVVQLCAPSTHIPHYRTHTRPLKDESHHHVSAMQEHVMDCLSKYISLKVDPIRTKSMAVNILGVCDDHIEAVVNLSIKGRSGPMDGCNGAITAPMLSKKDKHGKKA